jgi:hypothetical protein
VTEAGLVETLVQLDGEDVHLLDRHARRTLAPLWRSEILL